MKDDETWDNLLTKKQKDYFEKWLHQTNGGGPGAHRYPSRPAMKHNAIFYRADDVVAMKMQDQNGELHLCLWSIDTIETKTGHLVLVPFEFKE